jgi:glycosyltransferase involved in cell wall biosynthesis
LNLDALNIVLPGLLLALIIGQAVYVALYLAMRKQPSQELGEYSPPANIVLCLRGRDPTLERCLEAILNQDYPNYELHAVFDSIQDPAFPVVEAFRQRSAIPIRIHVIPQFSGQCGMKCEALITAIRNLQPECEVVALIDADSIAARNWLTEMVRPLQNSRVGVVTGDRWFEPGHDLASIARAVWNAAAIVQMNLYRIAWGGSMAMRLKTIERLGILDVWSRTFCEDTVLVDLFRQQNLEVVRPRLAVVFNNESIAWKNLHFWIARQLLTVRLHNRMWPFVFGHGLLVGLTVFLCFGLLVADIATYRWGTAALVGGSLLFAELLNFWLIVLIAKENLAILKANGQLKAGSSIRRDCWRWLWALPVTQLVHFLSTLRAFRMKHVIWRGIEYRVTKNKVELLNYRPFLDRNTKRPETSSVE